MFAPITNCLEHGLQQGPCFSFERVEFYKDSRPAAVLPLDTMVIRHCQVAVLGGTSAICVYIRVMLTSKKEPRRANARYHKI